MVRRQFVDTSIGQVHVVTTGPEDAEAVVLLHQTPRSWLEYRGVLPLLGRTFRVIAVDTPGMGDSAELPGAASIEGWADVVGESLAALGITAAHVVGHHTGGVIAAALAVRNPPFVRSLVLSSTPFTDASFRAARAARPPIDAVEQAADGAHLAMMWQNRRAFYPPDRPDLLQAFVADALKAADAEAGHRAVAAFRMEDVIEHVHQPVLVVKATGDPFAAPHAEELADALADARIVEIAGGMVPLPDQLPEEFAAVVTAFIGSLP